jgi:hypothetical protein
MKVACSCGDRQCRTTLEIAPGRMAIAQGGDRATVFLDIEAARNVIRALEESYNIPPRKVDVEQTVEAMELYARQKINSLTRAHITAFLNAVCDYILQQDYSGSVKIAALAAIAACAVSGNTLRFAVTSRLESIAIIGYHKVDTVYSDIEAIWDKTAVPTTDKAVRVAATSPAWSLATMRLIAGDDIADKIEAALAAEYDEE